MSIRTIETAADMTKWLPSDYENATDWTAAVIDAALVDGHDPRLIAAEVWEDYSITLPTEVGGGDAGRVTEWTNLDVSVKYDGATSPRDHARAIAAHHRARAKVRSVRFRHAPIAREAPTGLEDQS